jgi:hypothetical protein
MGQDIMRLAHASIANDNTQGNWDATVDWLEAQDPGLAHFFAILYPWYSVNHGVWAPVVFAPAGAAGPLAREQGGGGRGGPLTATADRPLVLGPPRFEGGGVRVEAAWVYRSPGDSIEFLGTPSLSAPRWERLGALGMTSWDMALQGSAMMRFSLPGRPEWEASGFLLANPFSDVDRDGLSDTHERLIGTDLTLYSTIGDGIPDGWKIKYGFDPLGPSAADEDTDGDGLLNKDEAGWCEVKTGFVPADMTYAADYLLPYASNPYGWFKGFGHGFATTTLSGLFSNPYRPAYFSGEFCQRVHIEINGVVYIQRWNGGTAILPADSALFNNPSLGLPRHHRRRLPLHRDHRRQLPLRERPLRAGVLDNARIPPAPRCDAAHLGGSQLGVRGTHGDRRRVGRLRERELHRQTADGPGAAAPRRLRRRPAHQRRLLRVGSAARDLP